MPIKCIGHRGGGMSAGFAENSLASIEHGLSLGVDGIEIDVWDCQGELLVFHDRRLGRVLSGNELLLELSPQALKARARKQGFDLPTLQEVMTLIGDRAFLNIEIKGPNCAHLVAKTIEAQVIDAQRTYEQYVVSSFDHHQIQNLLTINERIPRGVLIEGVPLDIIASCKALKAHFLGAGLTYIRQHLIDDSHRIGTEFWVYTVNHLDDIRHLDAMGVDAVFTDLPQLMMNSELAEVV